VADAGLPAGKTRGINYFGGTYRRVLSLRIGIY
jgi:hypothetical protein